MPTPTRRTRSPGGASATPATAASSDPVRLVGRLPFVGDRLLAQLLDEAERQRPGGRPGPVLARLAVSRQLREAVSTAVGAEVVPTYGAVYQYHRPGTEVRPHRDGEGFELAFHLTLEHEHPTSVLAVDGHDGGIPLPPGHGLVLRGQVAVHGWTALGAHERRTLLAIGFGEQEAAQPVSDIFSSTAQSR